MSKVRENLLVVVLVLFIARMGLPQYLKYILFPAVGLYGVWALWQFVEDRRWQGFRLRNTLIFTPLLVSMLIYFIMLVFTPNPQINLLRDAFNVLVFFSFVIALYLISYTPSGYQKVLNQVALYTFIISSLFAFLGVLKLVLQLYGITFEFLEVEMLGYPLGTSLSVDNNSFAILCLLGLVLAIPYTTRKLKIRYSLLLQLGLTLIVVSAFFSTSRRGLIIALLCLLICGLTWLVSIPFRSERLKNLRVNTSFFLLLSIMVIGNFYWFVNHMSPIERYRFLYSHHFEKFEAIHFINRMAVQEQLISNGNTEYSDVEWKLWGTEFDPRYPYTGWAENNFKLVGEIKGKGAELVPEGAEAALVDSSVQGSTWGGHAYYYSILFEAKGEAGSWYMASVYCYVSPDFSGDNVEIGVEHAISSTTEKAIYDLQASGSWQKLEVTFQADTAAYKVGLLMRVNNALNIKGLKGCMEFAYPELYKIQTHREELLASKVENNVDQQQQDMQNVNPMEEEVVENPNQEELLASKVENNVDQQQQNMQNVNPMEEEVVENPEDRKSDWFSSGARVLHNFLSLADSSGRFRHSMSNNFFSGPRIDRWRYALYIYWHEYSLVQKIFGGGFGYTRKFTDMFRDQWRVTEYDYPHSPFLSVMLYSGIFGLIFYIWLLLGAVKYYWIYRRDYWPFGLAFVVAFFFAFFSSNNPFEPAVLAVFTTIPYFAHYFYLVEKHG